MLDWILSHVTVLVVVSLFASTALILLLSIHWAVVLMAAALPFVFDLLPTSLPFQLALSDTLLALVFLRLMLIRGIGRPEVHVKALRPVRLIVAVYLLALLMALLAHFDITTVINTVQRIGLFAVPLYVGVFLYQSGLISRFLKTYAVVATVFALAWPLLDRIAPVLSNQKNPAGLVMSLGAVVCLAWPPLGRVRWFLIGPLMVGLIWTGSRSSIAGLGIALGVLVLTAERRTRLSAVFGMLLLILAGGLAFTTLNASAQDRILTWTSGANTEGANTIGARTVMRICAERVLVENPGSGIGVGNLLPCNGRLIFDPHNLVALAGAEGGYPLLIATIVLFGGVVMMLSRRAREHQVSALALAVFLATFAHGLYDVYWARGKPTLAWLLVGAALAAAYATGNPMEWRANSVKHSRRSNDAHV